MGDNDDVKTRKRVVPGSNPPIIVTIQPGSNLALCYETQQVSIKGCEIYNFQIPYRVRLEDYVELINEFADGRLIYYILGDGSDFLLFAGDTDRYDNRIDPRLYANQPNSVNNFMAFCNNLLQQRQQNLPQYNTLPTLPPTQQPEQPLRTIEDFDNYLNTFTPIQNPFREQTQPNPFDRRTQQPTNTFNNGTQSSNQRRSTRRSRGGRGRGGGGRGGRSSYEYTRGG